MNNIEAFYLNCRTSLKTNAEPTAPGERQETTPPAVTPFSPSIISYIKTRAAPKGGETGRIPHSESPGK